MRHAHCNWAHVLHCRWVELSLDRIFSRRSLTGGRQWMQSRLLEIPRWNAYQESILNACTCVTTLTVNIHSKYILLYLVFNDGMMIPYDQVPVCDLVAVALDVGCCDNCCRLSSFWFCTSLDSCSGVMERTCGGMDGLAAVCHKGHLLFRNRPGTLKLISTASYSEWA